jgi:hypothetical protein
MPPAEKSFKWLPQQKLITAYEKSAPAMESALELAKITGIPCIPLGETKVSGKAPVKSGME